MALDNRLIVVLVALIVAGAAGLLFKMTKTELSPLEDRGVIFGFRLGAGRLDVRLSDEVCAADRRHLQDAARNQRLRRQRRLNVADGTALLRLKDWNDRSRSQADVAKEPMPKFRVLPASGPSRRNPGSSGRAHARSR